MDSRHISYTIHLWIAFLQLVWLLRVAFCRLYRASDPSAFAYIRQSGSQRERFQVVTPVIPLLRLSVQLHLQMRRHLELPHFSYPAFKQDLRLLRNKSHQRYQYRYTWHPDVWLQTRRWQEVFWPRLCRIR